MIKTEVIGKIRGNWPYLTKAKTRDLQDEYSDKKKWPEECSVMITVTKLYRKRTLPQNSYEHGVLFKEYREGLIEKGWSPDEVTPAVVKQWLKERFLTVDVVNQETGEVKHRVKDTSELTTMETTEFIENVIRDAAENLGKVIFLPGEQSELEIEDLHKQTLSIDPV